MYKNIIQTICNGLLLVALSILTVNGSKNLDDFTGNILVRITFPIMSLLAIIVTRDVINRDYDG
ncbi:MAG: hypothetical protein IJH76_04875 [Clostridia bacterium]|nr:hypothetical protein [Clostridia bacterium]